MSDTERDPFEGTREARVADRVGRELRAEVPVRAEWRAGLLRGIATLPLHGRAARIAAGDRRRWALRPAAAIAAGLLCAVVGASVAMLLAPSSPTTKLAVNASRSADRSPVESASASAVRFVLVAPYASRVSLVGDFNKWNPAAMPMRRSADGRTWTVDVPLAPGRHVYSFLIDGDLAADPAAPRAGDDDFGVPSSVILVAGGRT